MATGMNTVLTFSHPLAYSPTGLADVVTTVRDASLRGLPDVEEGAPA
jgi:hypothetical protein